MGNEANVILCEIVKHDLVTSIVLFSRFRRILKNRTKEFVLDHDPMNSPLVKWTSPTKSSIYSRKGTIGKTISVE